MERYSRWGLPLFAWRARFPTSLSTLNGGLWQQRHFLHQAPTLQETSELEGFRHHWDDSAQVWRLSSEPALDDKPTRTEHVLPNSFAVVQVGGRQYRITKGDLILTESLESEIGERIRLKKVLLLGSKKFTIIGRPLVQKAVVEAVVEEQTKAAKVISFKKKRRKHHKRTKGDRHPITVLRIGDIRVWYESMPSLISESGKEAEELG